MKLFKYNLVVCITIFVSIAILTVVFSPTVAIAGSCGKVDTVILDCDEPNSADAIVGLVRNVIGILAGGIGIVTVGAVTYGAILYSSAGGNPDNIKKAKTM